MFMQGNWTRRMIAWKAREDTWNRERPPTNSNVNVEWIVGNWIKFAQEKAK